MVVSHAAFTLALLFVLPNQKKLQTKVLTFFKDDRNMSTQEIVYHKNARMI
jgi:hypothetical protein